MIEKTIGNFLNDEYKDYATYVIESRAIPNIIDGFKPVQRKILFTAMERAKSGYVKTAARIGLGIMDLSKVTIKTIRC